MTSNDEKIKKLLILCDKYYTHLDKETRLNKGIPTVILSKVTELKDKLRDGKELTSLSKFELAELKQGIIANLVGILEDPEIEAPNKIKDIENFLRADTTDYGATPASVLDMQRSSLGIKFLENIFHVLTLGFYSQITKGTPAFWKSHGEATLDAIRDVIKAP